MSAHLESCISPLAFAPIVSLTQWSSESSDTEDAYGYFDIPDDAPDFGDALDSMRLGKAVENFLNSLKPQDRKIVRRVFWEGESQASVARGLSVSSMAISKNMKKILSQGAQQLARFRGCELLF